MARPNKQGLDYFPLDVDFLEDEKMLAISGEFSVKGEIITLRLLCEIYRNGYFVEYSGLLKNKLARLGGLSGGLVDEVVKKLVEYNFFNREIFREHKILTSKGIQKRYFEAVKRRKDIDISHYWLLKGVNVNINSKSKGVNVNINPQIEIEKEIESKEEEREQNKILPPPQNDSEKSLPKSPGDEEKKVPRKKRIEVRKKEFVEKVKQYTVDKQKYLSDPDELNEFIKYWTEHGERDRKMRFEKETSYDIARRLGTWFRNAKKFSPYRTPSTPANAKNGFRNKDVIEYHDTL